MTNDQTLPPTWNTSYARMLSITAILLPIIGAVAVHIYDQPLLGRALHVSSVVMLFLMPVMFRQTLSLVFKNTCSKDEMQKEWHDRAIRKSYHVVIAIAWFLFLFGMFAAKRGASLEGLKDLMETFSMLVIAYAFIVPFTFLAWSIKPLEDE